MTFEERTLLDSINTLYEDFYNVLSAIELNSDFDEMIADDYPFDKSFDEMVSDVGCWFDTMKCKMKGERNDNT